MLLGPDVRRLELMPEAFKRMTWPAARLRAEREKRLRALLAHAKAHSTWHARRLAALDCDRACEVDLRALPPMTKKDLMDSFDEIVTDPRLTRDRVEAHVTSGAENRYLLDQYYVCVSGGSSGRRGVFVYDREAWTTCFVNCVRFNIRRMREVLGRTPQRTAIVAGDLPLHMTAALARAFPAPDDSVQRLSAAWPLERIVARLNEIQPTFLLGFATLMRHLALEAMSGRLTIAPKLVGTTSEPLYPEIKSALASAWQVPIYNTFGATEGLMGGSCGAERGIHLSDDLFVIEPVDANGDPVSPGLPAQKLLLTNLYNLAQPLIRYELTDEFTILDGPCPCGITLLRVDDVQGRHDDCFVYRGGPMVHPVTFYSILGPDRDIVEYQVVQTARGAEVLFCGRDGVDTSHLATALVRALRELGVADAAVSITRVEALKREASGKLRRFVPLS